MLGVDASFVRRENRGVGVDAVSEIARLRVSIDRAAAAVEIALHGDPRAYQDDDPPSLLAEREELCRQLGALRERVEMAETEDTGALRAELATLLSFARTLQADAEQWRSRVEASLRALERQRTAARRERETLAIERETLLRRRESLRFRIVQTAARLAQRDGGEWRRTLPVFTLGDGLTVCSASVSCPRKGLRIPKQWLVTLNDSRDDVLVRRE
jgi:hypothetical protein